MMRLDCEIDRQQNVINETIKQKFNKGIKCSLNKT